MTTPTSTPPAGADDTAPPTETVRLAAVAADLQDERLIQPHGIGGTVRAFGRRVRSGDIGSLPVVIGLIVIWVAFSLLNPNFLSSTNLVNLTLQCAAVGTISIGIVLVLLLGEIDLSVGSVSGLSAAILAVSFVNLGWPLPVSLLAALLTGVVIGLLYGLLYTRFGVPSFVITLAGLLGFLGLQLWVLGRVGSINIPDTTWIVQFGTQMFLPPWLSYVVIGLSVAVYAWQLLAQARRRNDAGLEALSTNVIALRVVGVTLVLGIAAFYLNLSRGVGVMFLFFLVLVTVMHFVLTRTRWGRAVYAVGGSVEAARRAGIRVNRVYISVFVLCSVFAATGGIMAAARLQAANQSSGGGDINLNAIAAAVIGGTSLFGGRGSAFSALLGVLVVMSISNGLAILNLEAYVRFMITGAVLVLAVIIDSLSRRSRAAAGRA